MYSRKKILVVDDDELTQDFFKLLLSSRYEVLTCGKVNDFYTQIQNNGFDLILMDVFLKDLKDGIQLTREVKMSEKFQNIPVFLITAQNSSKDRYEALEAGANRVLTKPIESKMLISCIDETLTQKVSL
jgi:DNA-binding response OmpR family regulator